jgi:uncharacterized protein (DUF983 family)
LFDGYIALKQQCPACGLDYAMFDAGDGLALWVEFTFQPPLWVHAVLWLPLICLLTAIFLRLSKSALLVLQYKHKAGEGRLGEKEKP